VSILYVPNSIGLQNFESIFSKNSFNFNDGNVAIQFHPSYVAMHPMGIAFYAALGDYFLLHSIKTSATINYQIRSIPYLQRMGFFGGLGYGNPVATVEHEEAGRFIPLTKIKTNEELETFMKNIDPLLHTSRETSRVIKHVFSELLRNVLEHSQATNGGNVCASYNRNRKKISIGISDAGIGIYNSLRHYHRLNSSLEAIYAALTPGISGTTARIGGTEENAGAGLFFTKCIAKSTRNLLVIYSGDASFKLRATPKRKPIQFYPDPRQDHKTVRDRLPYFQGTLIGIDIFIEDTETFNNLMVEIGAAYRLGVKKQKKDYYKRISFT
jgi:anti-sigma regulatory factor (Ser/Thr protein kinase)